MSRQLPTWSLGWLVPTLILLARPAAAGDVCAIVETTGAAASLALSAESPGKNERAEQIHV